MYKRQIRYNPVTKQEIENSGFDYIAFGHVHSFSGINVEGRTYWAYPGIPEPRGFDESGESGVVIGNVLKAGSEFNLRKVLKRNYHTLEIEITADISDNEQIIELIDSKIKAVSYTHLCFGQRFVLPRRMWNFQLTEQNYLLRLYRDRQRGLECL